VVSTVVTTVPAPTTEQQQTTRQTTQASPAVGGDPVEENNRAYAMMNAGDYNGALPLLRDAASQLQGQGSLAEAYTDYNLGFTLIQLGSCSEALDWLSRSLALQPQRKEVKDAIRQARRC
jgi:tetratricopeptide (TPR) repeat protein